MPMRSITNYDKKDMILFERLHAGESIPFDDPQYPEIFGIVSRTMKLLAELNASADSSEVRKLLGEITGQAIDSSTTIFLPFQINLGKFTRIGKNVFINHDCTFLDMGGITIEDDVLIGPKVCITTEGHPLNPQERKKLLVKPVVIKRNVWIGAGATILPGVTIGENSVVAAGSVVNKDVAANTVVAGVPAKVVKTL